MNRRGKPLKQFVLQYGRLFFDGDIHFQDHGGADDLLNKLKDMPMTLTVLQVLMMKLAL